GLFQIGLQSHADRYTYLPQIGLYLLATWTVAEIWTTSNAKRSRPNRIWKTPNVQRSTPNIELSGAHSALGVRRWALGVPFAAIILLALVWRAWDQTTYWKNSE